MSARYHVEVLRKRDGEWSRLFTECRAYCLGWLDCYRSRPGPKLAARVVQERDGVTRVVQASSAQDSVSLGMVAGWPTPEQYRAAAAAALEAADALEARLEADQARWRS